LLWHRWREGPRAAGRTDGEQEVRPGGLLALSMLAILTHPTLDWLNVYGMRWLMPFDGTWFYGDSLFILDPWLWLLLGGAWVGGRRLRRRGEAPKGARVARVLVGASVLYIAAMMTLSGVGRAAAARQLGLSDPGARELMVDPPALASWQRRVTVDAGPEYRLGTLEWQGGPRVALDSAAIPKRLELLDSIPRTAPLADLLDWARFPFARRIADSIHVDDARYARNGRSFAGVTVKR